MTLSEAIEIEETPHDIFPHERREAFERIRKALGARELTAQELEDLLIIHEALQPKEVDVEYLKKEYTSFVLENFGSLDMRMEGITHKFLDHLHQQGLLPTNTEWHPIDTAPMDGTKVDLYFEETGRLCNCQHDNCLGWVLIHSYPQVKTVFTQQPTHWKPITSPREVKAQLNKDTRA